MQSLSKKAAEVDFAKLNSGYTLCKVQYNTLWFLLLILVMFSGTHIENAHQGGYFFMDTLINTIESKC